MASGLKQANLQKTRLSSNSSGTDDDDNTPLTALVNIATTKENDDWMKSDDDEDNIPLVQLQLKTREAEEMREEGEDKQMTTLANYNNKDHTYSDSTYDSRWNGSEEFSSDDGLSLTEFDAIEDDELPTLHLQSYSSSDDDSSVEFSIVHPTSRRKTFSSSECSEDDFSDEPLEPKELACGLCCCLVCFSNIHPLRCSLTPHFLMD